MELDDIVQRIKIKPSTQDTESLLYTTENTSFLIQPDALQYSTCIPLTSRHRFNSLVEELPGNVLAYNFRNWLRKEPLRELGRIQANNKEPNRDKEGISYLRKNIQDHIPELVELLQAYLSRFSTP